MTTITPSLLQPKPGISTATRVAATDTTPEHTVVLQIPKVGTSSPVIGDARRSEQLRDMETRLELVQEQRAEFLKGNRGNRTFAAIEGELETLPKSIAFQRQQDQAHLAAEADKPAVYDGVPNEALQADWDQENQNHAFEIMINKVKEKHGISREKAFDVVTTAQAAGRNPLT